APTEGQPQGYANLQQVLSTRGSVGWSSQDIAVPHAAATGASVGPGSEYRFFSEDLSLAIVQPFGAFIPVSSPHALSLEASEQTAFLRTDYLQGNFATPCVSSCYRPLVTGAPGFANVPPGTVFGESLAQPGIPAGPCPPALICGPQFVGASPDGTTPPALVRGSPFRRREPRRQPCRAPLRSTAEHDPDPAGKAGSLRVGGGRVAAHQRATRQRRRRWDERGAWRRTWKRNRPARGLQRRRARLLARR